MFKGETSSLFDKMEEEMAVASENKNYELAENSEILLLLET